MKNETLKWQAPEYIFRQKGADWFWALWLIVVAGSIASILLKNTVFASFLVLAGITFSVLGHRKPHTVDYEIGPKGIRINSSVLPYSIIKAFWMVEKHGVVFFRITFKESSRIQTILINTEEVNPDDVYDMLMDKLEEHEIHLPVFERIADIVGV